MKWLKRLEDFLADDPDEPEFDPVDLASALIVTMVVIGGLYWLLWTLLVFEGGFFSKIIPALAVLLTSRTLQDFGCLGPYDRGAFEGWLGNLCAFILTIAIIAALHDAYREARRRHRSARD